MKQHRRRLRSTPDQRRSVFLARSERPIRRALLTERLEDRCMMASDFMSPYWNAINRSDVNRDGAVAPLDALVVINELNANGSYNLLSSSPAAGGAEGEQTQPQYLYDTNNDGHITPIDALIVINDLNAEGEGVDDVVRYYIYPVAVGTNTPIAEIDEGQDFELRMMVDDARPGGPGVFAAYIDIITDTSRIDLYVNEIQHVRIDGFPTGGTFTLEFNGDTTDPITYNDQIDMAASIKTALVALDTIGPNDVEVTSDSVGGAPRFKVKFTGNLGDTDVPALTGNGSGLTGGTPAMGVTIEQTAQGVDNDPVAFLEAFRTPFSLPNGFKYSNSPSASLGTDPDRFDDVGAVGQIFLPGTFAAIEFARVRMSATEGGRLDFFDDIFSVLEAHETLVYASQQDTSRLSVAPEEIGVYRSEPGQPLDGTPAFIFVKERVSANLDEVSTNEDTPVTISVLANDATDPPGGVLTLQSVNTTGTQGTAQIVGNTVVFTPAANFHGETSFTYVAADSLGRTDVGTVIVNVISVNDAPIITLPAAPTVTEDDPAVTLGAITVTDADVADGNLSVTLTSTKGVVTLATTAGLVNLVGDGTSSVTFEGGLAAVNAALSGIKFTPEANANGAASIAIGVDDQGNTGGPVLSDTKTLNFNIAAENDAPVLTVPGPLTVTEGDTLPITGIEVIDVDADLGGGVQVTLSVDHGILTLPGAPGDGTTTIVLTGLIADVNTALGNLVYTPKPDFFQTDTLSVEVSDLGHTGGPAQVVNDSVVIDVLSAIRPRARHDSANVAEDSLVGVLVDVLANDFVTNDDNIDPLDDATPIIEGISSDGVTFGTDPITIAGQGTLSIEGDQLRFIPAPNFDGTVVFSYQMTDSVEQGISSSVGNLTITVTPSDDAPIAADDTAATTEDEVVSGNLLTNDSDPDTGDTFSAVAATLTTALGASVTVNADGTFSYDPRGAADLQALAAAATIDDTFSYTIEDASGLTSTATVTVTVTGVNDAPVGEEQTYTVVEDNELSVSAPGLLTGATDVEDDAITVASVTQPAHGSVTFQTDGSFTYQPDENFNGADTFTYTLTDGVTESESVTVTINVTAENDLPVAVADGPYNTDEDTTLTISTRAAGVLGNDTDVESQATLTAELVSDVSNGTLTLNADGTFSYTPDADFNGTDSFTYRASDGTGVSNEIVVTINVAAVNDAPVGVADVVGGANEDAVFTLPLANSVLGNDTDVDAGDTKEVVAGVVTSAKGATVTLRADGTFDYDATAAALIQATAQGATTTDTFTYTVVDSEGATGTATVTITITGENDAPTANDDEIEAIANVAKTFDVLGNDNDIDAGDTLTVQSVTQPTESTGTVTINPNGQLVYTAPAGFEGVDTFTYTVVDSHGATSTATVTVTVQDYVPTDISGYVYIDRTSTSQANGNGLFEAGERGVANVTVVLSSPTGVDMFGDVFTPKTAVTDASGRYVFEGVIPGNYVITEIQPEHLRDGLETATDSQFASIQANQNNKIFISLPQLGSPDGSVEGNNFGEIGIDATTLDNSAGLIQEMLASSSQNGLVVSTNLAGDDFWFWALNNWSGLTAVDVQLSPNLSSLTLTATINGVVKTTTLGQQPNSNGARFRILGYTNEGGYLIRIDAKASDCIWVASSQPAGEGEAAGDADANYVDSVDQVLAEQSWA